MCFSINFQASSGGCFVCLFFFFPDEIALPSILRNELKRFALGAHSILREKKSQLASNFKLTRTPTIYGEHRINGSYTIMAKPIKTQELHYQMIQFLINLSILKKKEKSLNWATEFTNKLNANVQNKNLAIAIMKSSLQW